MLSLNMEKIMNKPKIAVYAISKNEAKFAKRFVDGCKDADYIVVSDTGSTDDTVSILQSCGAIVYSISVQPFRFDKAREASLALVPSDADICIALDLDEIMKENWREVIEKAWTKGVTKLSYPFVWSWTDDGKPAMTYYHSKVHSRHGYQWVSPCHELLVPVVNMDESVKFVKELEFYHYPDKDKPRSSYLGLLKVAVDEKPEESRARHYYARELFFVRQYAEAIKQFNIFFKLMDESVHDVYIPISYNYIAQCYQMQGDSAPAEKYYLKSAKHFNDWREPWIRLARMNMNEQKYIEGMYAVEQALRITTLNESYYSDNSRWDFDPYDIGSICAHYLGMNVKALDYVNNALTMAPKTDVERVEKNKEFMI
jgi:glycosyltransferase involved in cell wall biosynthesis